MSVITAKTGDTDLNYKCLHYDFGDRGYPVDGIEFNGFTDCPKS